MKILEHLSERDIATSELQNLLDTLLSHTSKSTFGQRIRKDDFNKAAEGKGFCSLKDLEVFLHFLFERSHGAKDSTHLLNTYKCCYELAFEKAKALAPSQTVNIITIAEYRAFLVYLCIFAAMLDTYKRCFGYEGESRGALVPSQSLFIENFKQGKGYGFTILENINNDTEAKDIYEQFFIDLNLKADMEGNFKIWVDSIIKAEPPDTEMSQFFNVHQKSLITINHHYESSVQTDASSIVTKMSSPNNNEANNQILPFHPNRHETSSKSTLKTLTIKVEQFDIDSKPLTSPSICTTSSNSPSTRSNRQSNKSSIIKSPTHSVNLSSKFSLAGSASRTLKDFLNALKPYIDKTLDAQKLRVVAFNLADKIGYGYCSSLDMENFLLEMLKQTTSSSKANDIHKHFQPIYQLAYDRAKPLDRVGDLDYIMFAEFRVFIIFTSIYAKILEVFHIAIHGKVHHTIDNEVTLPKGYFLKRYQILHNYGFIALNNLSSEDDASAVFDVMDIHGNGKISLQEFISYLEKAEIKMNTDLGQFIDVTKEQQLQTEKTALLSLSISQSLSISPTNSLSSSPIKISSIFTLGAGASHDLKKFVLPFIPYTEKTIEGQKLRVSGFKNIDEKGNGQVSMTELDNFIQAVLRQTYEESQASYLYQHFRPSYPRAYSKSKSLNPTKMGDFITVTEFRIFNAYTCIFASMFDAFSKVAGGDDAEITVICLRDFIDRFNEIRGYGFVALDDIRTKVEARELFEVMDTSGGETVEFDTFCSYLEETEERNMTSFGDLLGGAIKLTPTFSPPARLLMRGK